MPRLTPPQVVKTPQYAIKIVHNGHIDNVPGFKAAGVHAQIKKAKRDVMLLVSDQLAACAGLFTQNAVVAAPVILTRKHVAGGWARAIVCNAGNANACTGEQGMKDALRMAELAGDLIDAEPYQVLVASTGIIGKLMPMEKVESGIRHASTLLGTDEPGAAAQAIMTTDNAPKEIVVEVTTVAGKVFRVGGIAKGAGMIEPNMATMLGFLATDLGVQPPELQKHLKAAVEPTFNSISVDHDTSTNDMVLVLANGASGLRLGVDVPADAFQAALDMVTLHLAKSIARDGEGATKLIVAIVKGAKSVEDAKKAGKAIINSPLVKCAVHGSDPNWGRILAAVGYSGAAIDVEKVRVRLGNNNQQIQVLDHGEPLAFDPSVAHQLMMGDEVHIVVHLGSGESQWTVYGCDLTREYVDFNAHYTT